MSTFSVLGNKGTGNYVQVDDARGVQLFGDCTVFDDLRFPATAINPTGTIAPATFDTTRIGFSFSASATNQIAIIAQMPYGWKMGSSIHPHIHWHPIDTNTGNVYWRMEYKWTNMSDAEPSAWTTVNTLDAGDGVADKYQIADLGAISGTGKALSSILKIIISRMGGEATDTYASVAILDEFDIHYEVDTLGSSEEYTK